jgi:hypothetical protein
MSESNQDRSGVRWRMEADSDGWKWWAPDWRQRVATDSVLALTVEALRRAVELRDACAESGEDKGLTTRALFLVDVLNPLLQCVVTQRSGVLDLAATYPHDSLVELVQQLSDTGILRPQEYRPSD